MAALLVQEEPGDRQGTTSPGTPTLLPSDHPLVYTTLRDANAAWVRAVESVEPGAAVQVWRSLWMFAESPLEESEACLPARLFWEVEE